MSQGLDHLSAYGKFNTGRSCGAYVLCLLVHHIIDWKKREIKQILGLANVPVNATGKPASKGVIHTGIECQVGLPFKVLVTLLKLVDTIGKFAAEIIEATTICRTIGSKSIVIGSEDRLVT